MTSDEDESIVKTQNFIMKIFELFSYDFEFTTITH